MEDVKEKVYSVSEFNSIVKKYIDASNMKEVFIEGELSGVTYYKSGHLYFNLKDKSSQLKCVVFNYKLKKISEDLKEGEQVRVLGDVNFYEVRGEFHVLGRYVEKKNGLGELFAKLEKVKKEMEAKGYFDYKYKKELPKYPKNIGVVTAITGAAVQDIIKTAKKRDDSVNIYIYPAKVQGVGAKEEIIRGIEVLNKIPEIDMIIAGRGGGSIEDLWAFNEEETAIAFFNSNKPIISAVGHEIDNLLTDLTADARAATPTQAIELSLPEKEKTIEMLEEKKRYLEKIIQHNFELKKNELHKRVENYNLKNFNKIILDKQQLLIDKEERLKKEMTLFFEKKRTGFENRVSKLIGLNPLQVLERGYTALSKNGKDIKSINEIENNDEIMIRFRDGKAIGVIKERKYEKISD